MRAVRFMTVLAVIALTVASTGAWAGGEINLWFGQKNLDLKSQGEDFQSSIGSEFSRTSADSFGDLEDLSQFGLMTSWGLDWPVALAADLFYANSDVNLSYAYSYIYYYLPSGERGSPSVLVDQVAALTIDYTALELDLGIRKYWGGKVQFMLGAGLALASADVEASGFFREEVTFPDRGLPPVTVEPITESDSASDFGLWANLGFVWRAGDHFNLGLDVRYSSVNVDLTLDSEPGSDPTRFPAGGTQVGLFVGGRW